MAVAAPEANAYEFQAQGIVDMLSKLGTKFEDERTELEKEETNARHAFEMLSQDLKAQIDQATQARTEKAEAKRRHSKLPLTLSVTCTTPPQLAMMIPSTSPA